MTFEPSRTSDPAHSGLHRITRKLKHEAQEWIVMFLYLWVIFGLFALHQSILRGKNVAKNATFSLRSMH